MILKTLFICFLSILSIVPLDRIAARATLSTPALSWQKRAVLDTLSDSSSDSSSSEHSNSGSDTPDDSDDSDSGTDDDNSRVLLRSLRRLTTIYDRVHRTSYVRKGTLRADNGYKVTRLLQATRNLVKFSPLATHTSMPGNEALLRVLIPKNTLKLRIDVWWPQGSSYCPNRIYVALVRGKRLNGLGRVLTPLHVGTNAQCLPGGRIVMPDIAIDKSEQQRWHQLFVMVDSLNKGSNDLVKVSVRGELRPQQKRASGGICCSDDSRIEICGGTLECVECIVFPTNAPELNDPCVALATHCCAEKFGTRARSSADGDETYVSCSSEMAPATLPETNCGLEDAPSVQPTDLPTMQPTDLPTMQPTDAPATIIVNAPTSQPTNEPTVQPAHVSATPTQHPTDEPTRQPTNAPTLQIGETPTVQPTHAPFEPISGAPTRAPTRSVQPRPEIECANSGMPAFVYDFDDETTDGECLCADLDLFSLLTCICFDESSMVRVLNTQTARVNQLALRDVRVGDLLDDGSGSFSPLMQLSHDGTEQGGDEQWAHVLHVRHQYGVLKVTSNHMVYVIDDQKVLHALRADQLRVDHSLVLTSNAGASVNASIAPNASPVGSSILSIGMSDEVVRVLSPFTASGRVVIDGVLVSCYETPTSLLNEDTMHFLASATYSAIAWWEGSAEASVFAKYAPTIVGWARYLRSSMLL